MKYKTMMARSTVDSVINRACSSSAGKIVVIACTCISYGTSTFVSRMRRCPLAPRSRAGGVAQHEFRIDYHFMIGHRRQIGFGKQRFRSEEHTSELQSLRHLVC